MELREKYSLRPVCLSAVREMRIGKETKKLSFLKMKI